MDTDPAERSFTLARLKTGERIAYPISGITLLCRPMNRQEKKRLTHLLSFEAGDYRLDTFQLNSALYFKNDQHYHSMNELSEHGYLPRPAIALSPYNGIIQTHGGRVLDVFVPLGQTALNFTYSR